MAVPDPNHEQREARLRQILACTLAVTRWGLALIALGGATWVAAMLLPIWAGILPQWELMCTAMGLILLGLWAEAWNWQCALVANILNHGWPRTMAQIMRTLQALGFLKQGRYAREHCDELASYLAARGYRLVLFLSPHIWSLVAMAAVVIALALGGSLFE